MVVFTFGVSAPLLSSKPSTPPARALATTNTRPTLQMVLSRERSDSPSSSQKWSCASSWRSQSTKASLLWLLRTEREREMDRETDQPTERWIEKQIDWGIQTRYMGCRLGIWGPDWVYGVQTGYTGSGLCIWGQDWVYGVKTGYTGSGLCIWGPDWVYWIQTARLGYLYCVQTARLGLWGPDWVYLLSPQSAVDGSQVCGLLTWRRIRYGAGCLWILERGGGGREEKSCWHIT